MDVTPLDFEKKQTQIRLTIGFGLTRWTSDQSDPIGLDRSMNREVQYVRTNA